MKESLALLLGTALSAPEIVRTRKLSSVDKRMSSDISLAVRHKPLAIPCGEIDGELRPRGDSWTFAQVREIFANDVYLRRFRELPRASTVLDIGSNRGFFSILAIHVLGADRVVQVEMNRQYAPVVSQLLARNQPVNARVIEYYKACTSRDSSGAISINTILIENQIDQIDLLKVDIEGAEIDLFSENTAWLEHCTSIVMELHPGSGDVAFIPALLEEKGFAVVTTDQHNERLPFDSPRAEFAYATRHPGNLIM